MAMLRAPLLCCFAASLTHIFGASPIDVAQKAPLTSTSDHQSDAGSLRDSSDKLPLMDHTPVDMGTYLEAQFTTQSAPFGEPVDTNPEDRLTIHVREKEGGTENEKTSTPSTRRIRPDPNLTYPHKIPESTLHPRIGFKPKLTGPIRTKFLPASEITDEDLSRHLVEALDETVAFKELVDGESEAKVDEEKLSLENPLTLLIRDLQSRDHDVDTGPTEIREEPDPELLVVVGDGEAQEDNLSLKTSTHVNAEFTTTTVTSLVVDVEDLSLDSNGTRAPFVKSSFVTVDDEYVTPVTVTDRTNGTVGTHSDEDDFEPRNLSSTLPPIQRRDYAIVMKSMFKNNPSSQQHENEREKQSQHTQDYNKAGAAKGELDKKFRDAGKLLPTNFGRVQNSANTEIRAFFKEIKRVLNLLFMQYIPRHELELNERL